MSDEDDLPARFAAAQRAVQELAQAPDTATLLELYALYKQGTAGDVNVPRPGMLDFRGRAKWDAWEQRRGATRESAMQDYIALVSKLAGA